MNYLNEKGVGTAIHYPTPLPFQKAYSNYNYNLSDFTLSKKYSKEILSLPIFPGILSSEISYVSNTIREFYKM
jgi:dTDP-4-amino-4,6-dideoxygalactose transaminase